jgi:hypothetical protein
MEKAKTFGLIIALLLITFLLWSHCTRVHDVEYSNIIRTDTVHYQAPIDTINTIEVRWFDVHDTTTIHDTTEVLLIDSAKCLEIARNYVKLLVYNREIVNDSNLIVKLSDSVQFNSLKSGIVRYELKKVQPISKECHIGIGAMTDLNGVSIVGAYTTKNYLFFGGGDFIQKRVNFGLIRRF